MKLINFTSIGFNKILTNPSIEYANMET
jgi:hypothetical protein